MRMYPRPCPVRHRIILNGHIHARETVRIGSDTICNIPAIPSLAVVIPDNPLGS
jgi:hypothetical protein